MGRDTAELSRLLTSGREERNQGYLGEAPLLSAYLRYFLPWNIYRLCRLLPALPLPLRAGDAVTDLGSGPLTLPMALWISRPELRPLPLEFRCLDRTGAALDAGVKLFHALAGPDSPWVLRTVRAALGERIYGKPAQLVSAVNLFNELFWEIPPGNRQKLATLAERQGRLLTALAGEGGSILVVEPGIPRSGEFLTALRASLLDLGRPPLAPCPHGGPCPFPGGIKTKWCHFAFDTAGAPEELDRLSLSAGIPKERAVLSFLLAGPRLKPPDISGRPDRSKPMDGPILPGGPTPPEGPMPLGGPMPPVGQKPAKETKPSPAERTSLPVRIISDMFPLPSPGGDRKTAGKESAFGRYGCSPRGAILVRGGRNDLEHRASGDLIDLYLPAREERDPKSGALVVSCNHTQVNEVDYE